MKDFEFDPESFSHKEVFIGGINTFVYNADAIAPYIEKLNKSLPEKGTAIPINVLYLVHYRGGDYKFTESTAYTILKQYYEKKPDAVPLVCVTFDNRNHGTRVVDKKYNSSWKLGNLTHGVDMVSQIHGNVADLKLVIDYLSSYLNVEALLAPHAKELDISIGFRNLLSGYSVGGHTIIRFANEYPDLVDAINPNVGCSDLTDLLLTRLFKIKPGEPDFEKKRFYATYDELPLTPEQRKDNYPEAFHKKLAAEDTKIFEDFPFKIKAYATFGAEDRLVPPSLSRLWIDLYKNNNLATEEFTQEGVGHDITIEMLDGFSTWLVKHF